MPVPSPTIIHQESFQSNEPPVNTDPRVVTIPGLQMLDLVVLILGDSETINEVSVDWNGTGNPFTEEIETNTNSTPKIRVFWGIAGLGSLDINIKTNGTWSQDMATIAYVFRGNYHPAAPVEVKVDQFTLAGVTSFSTGTTPMSATANAFVIAALNHRFGNGAGAYTVTNGFGNIKEERPDAPGTSLISLFTAELSVAATQTFETTWDWSVGGNANSAAAGIVVVREGTPATVADGEFDLKTLQLNLLTMDDLKQFLANPASIAPKANHANLISFHWGRSANLDQCRPHVRGYTDWSSDVGVGADVYIALPTIEIRNFRIHGGTQSKPVEIRLPADVVPINAIARPFPHARLRVRIAEVDPDNPQQTFKELFVGDVTRVSKGRAGRSGIVDLEVSSYKERLNVSLGIIADTTCAWQLGDKNCCIDLGNLPVIETYPRCVLFNDNVDIASDDDLETREPIDNIIIFSGEGHVVSANTHFGNGQELGSAAYPSNGGFVDPETGDFASVGTAETIIRKGPLRVWDGTTKRLRFEKYLAMNLISGCFLPESEGRDLIVGRSSGSGAIIRIDARYGIVKWTAIPSSAGTGDDASRVEHDGSEIFVLQRRVTNGPSEFVTSFNFSGVEQNIYEDPNMVADVPLLYCLAVDGSRVYAGGVDLNTTGGRKNLWAWDKGAPATPLWSILVNGNRDILDIALYNGSLWAVGNGDGADQLWEVNPATGAILNSYAISDATTSTVFSISIDQTTGIGFVAIDRGTSSPNPGRVHVIDFGTDPSTILDSWYDTVGNEGDPKMVRVLPSSPGFRELRTISQINGPLIGFVEPLPDPKATGTRFNRGYVENDDVRIMIREQQSLTAVLLTRDPPPEWQPGLKISLTPGCDKTINTCRDEWDREEKFAGIGFGIPRYNPLFESS